MYMDHVCNAHGLCMEFTWIVYGSACFVDTREEGEVNFPITAGWTPNKQFCFSKSAPFRILWTMFAAKWSSNGGLEAVVSK